MREKTNLRRYLSVTLDKKVPMQAGHSSPSPTHIVSLTAIGLGGGSGNAASAMFAFNALLGYPASNEELKQWSGDIGSDITFFFSTGEAVPMVLTDPPRHGLLHRKRRGRYSSSFTP